MAANASLHPPAYGCDFPQMALIMSSSLILYILMVPFLVFVLVVGFQQWRKQPSASPHVDVLSYNAVVLDLLGAVGMNLLFIGTFADKMVTLALGNAMFGISAIGHPLLDVFTCMERYLAVVHPIFYLRLRGAAGVRMRNVIIGCVWLISGSLTFLSLWLGGSSFISISFTLLVFTSVAFCFSSVSTLCFLIRPGPGEGGRTNRLGNQSKQRAVHTMAMITGVLSMRVLSGLIFAVVQVVSVPFGFVFCAVGLLSVWFHLPTNLVLPLLFLHRVGKLKVCGHKPGNTA